MRVRGFFQSFHNDPANHPQLTRGSQPTLSAQRSARNFHWMIGIILSVTLWLCAGADMAIAAPASTTSTNPSVNKATASSIAAPTPMDLSNPVTKPTPAKGNSGKPEVSLGERVFSANCASCHIGGNNIILAEKNLSKEALATYAMNSVAAIKMQVTNGKNAMPAFGENLTSAEIEAVARYVISQSQVDWKGSSVGFQ